MSNPAVDRNGAQLLVEVLDEMLAGINTKFAGNNKRLEAYREHQSEARPQVHARSIVNGLFFLQGASDARKGSFLAISP